MKDSMKQEDLKACLTPTRLRGSSNTLTTFFLGTNRYYDGIPRDPELTRLP